MAEDWEAAEDSEVEREKQKKAAEEKAKVEAIAAANKKSRAQRIEEKREAHMKAKMASDDSSEDEDEADKRARLRKTEQEADLKNAEDLFSGIGISKSRTAVNKAAIVQDPANSENTIDLTKLPIFNPTTKDQFTRLRETVAPLIAANAKKGQYPLFMEEFSKEITRDLTSDQIKKISSKLATLSNEKMKEEKAAEKGPKRSKAAKTKTSLVAGRNAAYKADTTAYDDGGLE